MLFFFCIPAAASGENLIFIFDGSNSMWGKVDGKHKITIAKEILTNIINTLPDGQNVGLLAYGHRREGDCKDVEELIPLGPLDRKKFIRKIKAIMPRGRTSLAHAIQIAAERLKVLETEAVIILVSDDKDVCNEDPCMMVRQLRESGIRFVMNVIGFDADEAEKEQLECIAKAGGGEYYTAMSAEEFRAVAKLLTEESKVAEMPVEKPGTPEDDLETAKGDLEKAPPEKPETLEGDPEKTPVEKLETPEDDLETAGGDLEKAPPEKPETLEGDPEKTPVEGPGTPEDDLEKAPPEKPETLEGDPGKTPVEKPETPEDDLEKTSAEKSESAEDDLEKMPTDNPETPEDGLEKTPTDNPETAEDDLEKTQLEKPETLEGDPEKTSAEEPEIAKAARKTEWPEKLFSDKWTPDFDPSAAKYKCIVFGAAHLLMGKIHTGLAFRDEIWKRTDGQIYIDYKSLTSEDKEEPLSRLMKGEIQGAGCDVAAVTKQVPRFALLNLPFLINSSEALERFIAGGQLFDHCMMAANRHGIISLGITDYGNHGWAATVPIKTVEDARIIKFRFAKNPVRESLYKAWEINGAVMPWQDVQATLDQGKIAGLDHAPTACTEFKKIRYYTQVNDTRWLFIWLFNKAWLNKLPADLQEIFKNTVSEVCATVRQKTGEWVSDEIARVRKEGIEFLSLSKRDMNILKKQGNDIHRKYEDDINTLHSDDTHKPGDYLKEVQYYMGYRPLLFF